MRIVIARHFGNPKDYVFCVPETISDIHPGDELMVETAKGVNTVFAHSGIVSISTDQLETLAPMWGCKLPLAHVIRKQVSKNIF